MSSSVGLILSFNVFTAIGGHTNPCHIILRKNYRSIIYRIIVHGKSSTSLLSLVHVVLNIGLQRFQKAIKKVRAVQRMRKNRGFAFSQTENAGKQDQAKLIRAYDTSKSHARPTGY